MYGYVKLVGRLKLVSSRIATRLVLGLVGAEQYCSIYYAGFTTTTY